VKLLVVEDSATQRQLLTELLRPRGHEVREAACGSDALEELARDRPDVLLLDLVMPGLDGPALLEALAGRGATPPPVVVTTAWPHPLPAFALPVTVLRKPFTVEELEAAIARAAEGEGGAS
jgi:CheY-like chemotaxis protein